MALQPKSARGGIRQLIRSGSSLGPTMLVDKKDSKHVLKLRWRLGLNQHEFWSSLGVTQSGGSRYESGRRIPQPVAKLIELAYGNKPLQALKQLRRER